MSQFYERYWRLEIAGYVLEKMDTLSNSLRFSFEIETTASARVNRANFTLYNLPKRIREKIYHNLLEKDYDKNADAFGESIAFSVGYLNLNNTLFQGRIRRATSSKVGSDFVTKIEAIPLTNLFAKKKVSINENATLLASLESVSSAFDVAIDDDSLNAINAVNKLVPARQNWVLNLENVLQKIEALFDVSLYLDNTIKFFVDVIPNSILEVSPSSGLIGTPELTEEGINITSLLLANIRHGNMIRVVSDTIIKDVYVVQVNHVGDTHTNQWFSTIETLYKINSSAIKRFFY